MNIRILVIMIAFFTSQNVSAALLLDLSFDSTLNGDNGEIPATSVNTNFVPALVGNGVELGVASELRYQALNNIVATEGSLDFVIIPDWSGGDGESHEFLTWGLGGGMLFSKDGASNIRSIYNRFGANGQAEFGESMPLNVSAWQPNEAHYLAFSWSNIEERIRVFIDGDLVNENVFPAGFSLPNIAATDFQLGANLSGVLDELRIFDNEISEADVAARFAELNTLSVPLPTGLTLMVLGVFAIRLKLTSEP